MLGQGDGDGALAGLREDTLDLLVCPRTKLRLTLCAVGEAEARIGAPLAPREDLVNASNRVCRPIGLTPWVLLREDLQCAYPVVDGIPVLLVPEMLTARGSPRSCDVRDPIYGEAYQEMEFYNRAAAQEAEDISRSETYRIVAPAVGAADLERASFPDPPGIWLDAVYDCASQWDAYKYLAPVGRQRVLQLGGKGAHAVKLLLAGADEAWAVSPMLGEMRCARALAVAVGVRNRLHCAVAVGEQLPFAADSIDRIYAGGCLHHMSEVRAIPEVARVLRKGGRFAAVDPWRAPFYSLGTRVLGKRERNVYCKPMTTERLEPWKSSFDASVAVHHGTLTRYALLALSKFGLRCSLSVAWRLTAMDDSICATVPRLRKMGSSVALLGTK